MPAGPTPNVNAWVWIALMYADWLSVFAVSGAIRVSRLQCSLKSYSGQHESLKNCYVNAPSLSSPCFRFDFLPFILMYRFFTERRDLAVIQITPRCKKNRFETPRNSKSVRRFVWEIEWESTQKEVKTCGGVGRYFGRRRQHQGRIHQLKTEWILTFSP